MATEHSRRGAAILMMAYTNYETDPRVIRAAEAAAEAGFAVDFIALRRAGQPAEEMISGVRVLRVNQERYRAKSRVGYLLAYGLFFARCFGISAVRQLKCRYRVVHVNNMPDLLVFAALVPKLLGAKIILDIHDPMPETFGAKYGESGGGRLHRLLLAAERASVAFSTRTVTVNHPVRDGVLVKHGYSPAAIDVIANFADDRLFRPIAYPAIDGYVRFVFHGTIIERYGLRTLVEAVVRARRRDRIRIRLIGEGDFSERLKQLIAERGVGDVVEFINRVFPLHEIPAMLADCHAGIVPLDVTPISDFALPLKLIEYTCLGLPSVTVTSTAIAYYFHSDECFFFPPGDVDSLARILDDIAGNPMRLEECRKRLPAVRARTSWTLEKQKYVEMLRDLCGTPAVVSKASPAGNASR